MLNKEEIGSLWEQVIQKEEDPKKAMGLIVKLMKQVTSDSIDEMRELRAMVEKFNKDIGEDLKSLRKTLYGDGDPSHSILARLDRIEEQQRKSAENANKVFWTVISAVIVQIVLYLLGVL